MNIYVARFEYAPIWIPCFVSSCLLHGVVLHTIWLTVLVYKCGVVGRWAFRILCYLCLTILEGLYFWVVLLLCTRFFLLLFDGILVWTELVSAFDFLILSHSFSRLTCWHDCLTWHSALFILLYSHFSSCNLYSHWL